MAHSSIKSTGLRTFIEGAQLGIAYTTAIALGEVEAHSSFRGFGRRDSLATTAGGDDISNIAAVAISFPNQSVGDQMTIVSDSANDAAAGSGARTVKIHYLDASGNYLHEIVTLNGVTGVNTVATNIRFIQLISVDSVGSFGGKNAGNITIYKLATPATVYLRIVVGDNVSLSSARMVPNGKTFYLTGINASATSSKSVSARLLATCDHAGDYIEGVFQFEEIIECQDSVASLAFAIPRKIPSLAILKGVAVSSQAGGSVSMSYDGWIE